VIFHFFRSYNKGSIPLVYSTLARMVRDEVEPDVEFRCKDVVTYAYSIRQYRRLMWHVGKPDFPYGFLVKRSKNEPDSDPDCDDLAEIAYGKANEERLKCGSKRPAMFLIDYSSQSRKCYHEAILFLAANKNGTFTWWIYQYDTQKFEPALEECGHVRELW